MLTDSQIIKNLRFAEDFDEGDIQKVLDISSIKEFSVKEPLFEEYEEVHELFILIEGSVVLGLNVPKKGKISFTSVHKGHVFSWSALFPPHISTASAVASTPVKVLSIPSADLLKLFESDTQFGFRFMRMIAKTISQRLSDTRLQLVNVVTL
jgi:CRP-like cAMP-binding protein